MGAALSIIVTSLILIGIIVGIFYSANKKGKITINGKGNTTPNKPTVPNNGANILPVNGNGNRINNGANILPVNGNGRLNGNRRPLNGNGKIPPSNEYNNGENMNGISTNNTDIINTFANGVPINGNGLPRSINGNTRIPVNGNIDISGLNVNSNGFYIQLNDPNNIGKVNVENGYTIMPVDGGIDIIPTDRMSKRMDTFYCEKTTL